MEPITLIRRGEKPNRGDVRARYTKGASASRTSASGTRDLHASAQSNFNAVNRMAEFRARVDAQVKLWEEEFSDLEERASATEIEARHRAGSLLGEIDTKLGCWYPSASRSPRQNETGPSQPTREAVQSEVVRYRCELADMRARACRADTIAQQAYRQQVAMLRVSIAEQIRAWHQELKLLHAGADAVWTEALSSKLDMTQRKLSVWGGTGGGTWQGFMDGVESVLRQAEFHLIMVAAGLAAERNKRRVAL